MEHVPPSPAALTCRGRIRTVDGKQVVVLEGENCPGCNGACRLRFVAPQLTLRMDDELPDGTAVEVVASPSRLVGRAALVFGIPLFAALIAAIAVERTSVGAWLIPAALLAAGAALIAGRWFAGVLNGAADAQRDTALATSGPPARPIRVHLS